MLIICIFQTEADYYINFSQAYFEMYGTQTSNLLNMCTLWQAFLWTNTTLTITFDLECFVRVPVVIEVQKSELFTVHLLKRNGFKRYILSQFWNSLSYVKDSVWIVFFGDINYTSQISNDQLLIGSICYKLPQGMQTMNNNHRTAEKYPCLTK